MKHVGKRLLAVLLAVVMVLGSVGVVSAESSTDVTKTKSVEESSYSNCSWWGGNTGHKITVNSTDCTWTYTVTVNDDNTDFGFEIYDASGRYISVFTYAGAWTAGAAGTLTSDILHFDPQAGTYTATIVRDGQDFSLTIADSNGETVSETTVTGTDIDECASAHVYVQYCASEVNVSASATYTNPEGLEGTAWWTDYQTVSNSVSGEGTWAYTFTAAKLQNSSGAITVEVTDGTSYASTSSNLDGWGIQTIAAPSVSSLTWAVNSVYTVVVTRTNGTLTVSYYQDGILLNDIEFDDTLGDDLTIVAGVHIGTFTVEFSDLNTIEFLGGSLRMDSSDYDTTSLRFGYTVTLPDGAELTSWHWNWGTDASNLSNTVTGVNKVENGSEVTTNLVITGIPSTDYDTTVYSQLVINYELDGVTYTVTDSVQSRTVEYVATAISTSSAASETEQTYAAGILAAMQ